MASAARSRWILAAILIVSIVVVWALRRQPVKYTVAYVADHAATLWTTTAQVRQAVATLGYGERVEVLRQVGDQSQVRTDDGAQGWVETRLLMDTAMWQKIADLLARAKTMPVQAVGHTRGLSNVHSEPGRDTPRIFQFGRDVPVLVLQRRLVVTNSAPPAGVVGSAVPTASATPAVTESPAASGAPIASDAATAAVGAAPPVDDAAAANSQKTKDDWLFVLRAPQGTSVPDGGHAPTGGDTPIAGWVLGRFISLDPPQPIPDYSSAAGMRVMAWAVLNTVPDEDGAKPQYLVAGTRGGDDRACDFTSLRVYTWDAKRKRYETAYIENDLCGTLPIAVQTTPTGADFHFTDLDDGEGQRMYRMRQTVVRRVKTDGEGSATPAGSKRR